MNEMDWMYDGNSSSAEGISFEGTHYLQDSKDFLFEAIETGKYRLRFTRPDLDTGTVKTVEVFVTVSDSVGGMLNPDDSKVSRLRLGTGFSGEQDAAVQGKGEKSVYGRVCQEESGSFSAEVLREGLAAHDKNILGRQLSLLVKQQGEIFSGKKGSPPWEEILDASAELENSPYEEEAAGALTLFLQRGAGLFDETGRVYYLLGRIYESPALPRDERIAVDYYGKVLEIFPAGIYHFKAEERIRYLERHFIQIR
jgi:hypothetical protein